ASAGNMRRRVPATPFGAASSAPHQHGVLGSNVKGSSLPHCSGVPFCRNLALRAFDRWQASWIICGVADLGRAVAVVKLPALAADVAVAVDVVAVWADAETPTMA